MQQYRNPYDRAAEAEQQGADPLDTYSDQAERGSAMKGDREIPIVEQGESEEPKARADEAPEESSPADTSAQDLAEDQDVLSGDAQYTGPLFGGTTSDPSPEAGPDLVTELTNELSSVKSEMEDLRLRQAAEMENFKKRLAREHQEQLLYAAEKVLGDLLPTLDNLELALTYGTTNEACKDLLQGVSMTHKLLLDCVQKHGLVPVGTPGEVFDPAIHEAVGFDPNTEQDEGTVARVLQRGYKLGNRLLRAAKVMIAKKG